MKRGHETGPGDAPKRAVEALQPGMDPDALVLALRATGANLFDAVATLKDSGADPLAFPSLQAWAMAEIRKEASQKNPKTEWSFLEGILKTLLALDPAFANAAFKACEGLDVNGRLNLKKCNGLRDIPIGMKVQRGLYLHFSNWLERLPAGLVIGEDLDLEGCAALKELPEGLQVGGHLVMQECTSLKRLTDNLQVGGELYLWGCVALGSLRSGLRVGKNLCLGKCASLRVLPDGLQIGGDLDLRDCQSWDGVIPGDARVDGKIHTDLDPHWFSMEKWRKLHP